ncbi:hypothetical protein D3C79_778060 [compost metagenome]
MPPGPCTRMAACLPWPKTTEGTGTTASPCWIWRAARRSPLCHTAPAICSGAWMARPSIRSPTSATPCAPGNCGPGRQARRRWCTRRPIPPGCSASIAPRTTATWCCRATTTTARSNTCWMRAARPCSGPVSVGTNTTWIPRGTGCWSRATGMGPWGFIRRPAWRLVPGSPSGSARAGSSRSGACLPATQCCNTARQGTTGSMCWMQAAS